jgi:hypothetical protein
MKSSLPYCLVVLVFVGLAHSQPPAPRGPQLILLDGTAAPFQSLQISVGKLSGEGVPADLSLDDLRRIEIAAATPGIEQPAVVLELRGGGRLRGKSLTLGDDKCQVGWMAAEPLNLPIDLVRAIRLQPGAASPDFEKALATPSVELDRIFLQDEMDKLTSVPGLVESLTDEQLTFEAGGQMRSVPRSRLFGIVVAQGAAADPPARCLVEFKDGSLLGGESLELAGQTATLAIPAGGKAEFAWSAVARVNVRSSRVSFLSDLKPTAEEQSALVTLARPAQRDKSVLGRPLVLGNKSFDKGLGVHARSLLSFAAESQWDTLAATIGLDPVAGGKGDCVFRVLADGQQLFERRMKGNDPPQELSLPIAGREQITLVVEPGAGLDLGDAANWCDVRFIKNRQAAD